MKNRKLNIKHIVILFACLCVAFLVLIRVVNNYKDSKEQRKIQEEQERLYQEELEKQQLIENLDDNGYICIALNEKYQIGNYISQNEEIVTIENGYLIGKKLGTAIVYSIEENSKYNIAVSDLFNAPTIDNNKISLPCGLYNNEQAAFLDNALQSRISFVGEKTRAAVVEAARFLALNFAYRIPYFYENGRLDGSTGHPYADGEGRFYHKGLYLSDDKYSVLDPNGIVEGPQIWGCEMFSGAGGNIPNGLDCSGYVSWCLYQAGFDPGDVGGGAGIWDGAYNLPDLGVGDGGSTSTKVLDPELIQAGDIICWEGTIALVIGVDEKNIYVAHAYWDNDLEVITTPKANLANSEWEYCTLMDNYYNDEGNGKGKYTSMWN